MYNDNGEEKIANKIGEKPCKGIDGGRRGMSRMKTKKARENCPCTRESIIKQNHDRRFCVSWWDVWWWCPGNGKFLSSSIVVAPKLLFKLRFGCGGGKASAETASSTSISIGTVL